MINVKVTLNESLADPAHAAMHLVHHSWIYIFNELIKLAGTTCSLIDATYSPDARLVT